MSKIKARVAQGLKTFGLHPRSEVRELERRIEEVRTKLEGRNGQLESRNRQLQNRNEQLKEAQRRLQQRNEQIEELRERLRAERRAKGRTAGSPGEATAGEGFVWHRKAVGGMWEEVGRLQLDFMRGRGLEPEHYLLDVGCGSLRGGVRLIPYLEPGHYYGVDRNQRLLDAGRTELEAANLQDRAAVLAQMDDFGFERLDRSFDFILAQSLFSHLPLNTIARCLVGVARVLRPGGTFYATFFENREGKVYLDPIEQGDGFRSHYDADPYHYTRDALEWACEGTRLSAEYLGDWGHPRNQMMMAFRRET